jgi:hypothetical protein
MIKQWILNWLGIEERFNASYKQIDNIVNGYYNETRMYINETRELKQEYGKLLAAVTKVDERLRPDLRQRLEQVKSAIDISTSFLNEIRDEIMVQKYPIKTIQTQLRSKND